MSRCVGLPRDLLLASLFDLFSAVLVPLDLAGHEVSQALLLTALLQLIDHVTLELLIIVEPSLDKFEDVGRFVVGGQLVQCLSLLLLYTGLLIRHEVLSGQVVWVCNDLLQDLDMVDIPRVYQGRLDVGVVSVLTPVQELLGLEFLTL